MGKRLNGKKGAGPRGQRDPVHKGKNAKPHDRKRGARKHLKPGRQVKAGKLSRYAAPRDEGVKVQKRRPAHVVRRERRAEPQLIEGAKPAMILRGPSTSERMRDVLKDLASIKQPHAKTLSRKNQIYPFEDESSLEFLSQKNDCSLFALGSHNKKRPHNLTLGRMFDYRLLDMVELGVDAFEPIAAFTRARKLGSRPCVIFEGSEWEQDATLDKLRSLLLDLFRGAPAEQVALANLEGLTVCTAARGKVYVRNYLYALKRSGTRKPRVELEPAGPSMDLSVRRTKFASVELYKLACRQPRELKARKVKNISHNEMGDRVGRVHMERQELDKLALRKMKGLRKTRGGAAGAQGGGEGGGGMQLGDSDDDDDDEEEEEEEEEESDDE